MQPRLVHTPVSEYQFAAPGLVYDGQLTLFEDPQHWQSGTAWADAVESVERPPQAVVIPLELAAVGRTRQDLLGYELLSSLRWSTPDPFRGCPVLLTAWQPFQDILRRHGDLLLVRPAVEFTRLPEARDRLPAFIRDVVQGRIVPVPAAQIAAAAGPDEQASRVSYHDLANDYYAAYRVWKGYQSLLRNTARHGVPEAAAELEAVAGTRFAWESKVETSIRSALVRRFQATHAGRAPRYPTIEHSHEIAAYHLRTGLPPGTRILLVDDEFQKGSAEVLLRVLFRQAEFTRRLDDQWVYSEATKHGAQDRWARFVCVNTADLARNWLAYWEGIAADEIVDSRAWQGWLKRWLHELSPAAARTRERLEAEDVIAANRDCVLDRQSAGPRVKSTVVLLDLRLEPVQEALYSITNFSSYQLRRTIKAERPALPVVMYTASRQVLNLAELLDSSSAIDGWFVKEGPDTAVDADDANSANAVAYLLERLHLYSTLRGWYRESFAWDAQRKLAYAQMIHSPDVDTLLPDIACRSTALFAEIRAASCDRLQDTETFWSFVQARVPAAPFPVVQTLVARRLVVATLLWTADVTAGSVVWNVNAFAGLLPGRPVKKLVKAIYDKLNFNQALWMRTEEVWSQLLPEEIDWLTTIDWPAESRALILETLGSRATRGAEAAAG